MKRFVAGVIFGFIIATAGLTLANQPIKLIINNEEIQTDVPPQMIDGRVMVPARFVAEPLGATVEWDGENMAIIITKQLNPANTVIKKQDILFYPGRKIFDVLGAKYPKEKITGLGQNNILWIGEQFFELPFTTENSILYYSIEPLINAGLVTTSDFQDN